jgi:ribosomal protein S18 acetylase RimI-like enzyme
VPGGEMIIRQFRPEDEQAVIALWQECDLTRPWNNPKADIERKMEAGPDLFLVGTVNGSIVATAMGGYDGHRGWVYYLAVDPVYRKSGLGRRMMETLEEKLTAIGCPKIDLMIRKSNNEVVQFYERIGYTQEDTLLMSRRLIEDGPQAA